MSKGLTHRQYIALVAVASAAILVLGVLLKPKQLPTPTISNDETLRLQTLTQRRNLENLAVYFSEVAGSIQPGLVWLNEIGQTGLVWNDQGLIVTAGPDHPVPEEVTALTTSGTVTAKSQAVSVHFRIASLLASGGARLQPVRKGTLQGLTPGIWIIQVARQAKGDYLFTPGVYGGVAPTRCGSNEYQALQSNLPLTESALGGGQFDVDGNLLAVVLRCDDHFAAVVPAEVARELARANSFEGQLLQGFGLQASALDEVSRKYFQANEGVLVTSVTDGQPADDASLMPGDVITSLDKAPVRGLDDLRPLMKTKDRTVFQLDVRRSGRTVRIVLPIGIPVTTGDRQDQDSRGIALTNPPGGYLIETVLRGSRAQKASIQAGDRLLLVDGKAPQSVAAVRKTLSADSRDPIFLLLHRGSQKLGVFLN